MTRRVVITGLGTVNSLAADVPAFWKALCARQSGVGTIEQAFAGYTALPPPTEANRPAWREALGEEESLKVGRPVDLNSDEPDAVVRQDKEFENDPLSIRRDVGCDRHARSSPCGSARPSSARGSRSAPG